MEATADTRWFRVSSRSCAPRRQWLRLPADFVRCVHAARPFPAGVDRARHRLGRLANEFRSLPEPLDRVKRLLDYASELPAFPEAGRVPANAVSGCTARVWLAVAADDGEQGRTRMRFAADSDSEIAKGFCSCIVTVLDGALPEEVLEMTTEDFGALEVMGSPARAVNSRVNTWNNVLISMQKRTRELMAAREEKEKQQEGGRFICGTWRRSSGDRGASVPRIPDKS
ncbi:sufE-like protein 2, chloroplastic [Zingiber officinale]|uniref:sufE-like protein 2, chloroplastic n=1 Tax=Zingiber officinale TaxID=94328 RepID=UPI001C4CBA90|nr:sufE-like protein 2, chloroplastic [Zingiber officinale]